MALPMAAPRPVTVTGPLQDPMRQSSQSDVVASKPHQMWRFSENAFCVPDMEQEPYVLPSCLNGNLPARALIQHAYNLSCWLVKIQRLARAHCLPSSLVPHCRVVPSSLPAAQQDGVCANAAQQHAR